MWRAAGDLSPPFLACAAGAVGVPVTAGRVWTALGIRLGARCASLAVSPSPASAITHVRRLRRDDDPAPEGPAPYIPGRMRIATSALALALAATAAASAAEAPRYLCVVNGVDDFRRDLPAPSPGDARMACTATIHYTLLRTPAEIAAEVAAALDQAEVDGYPVFLTFDDWNFPPDAWAADPSVSEWTDWNGTPATHRTIEWSSSNPENPPPNVESLSLRAALRPVFDAAFRTIAARARRWSDEGRGHLFAGIAVGWESGYYTEFDETPAFRTGFAALTARGLDAAVIAAGAASRGVTVDEEFDAQMYLAIHEYVEWLGGIAVRAGIPRAKVYTHFTGAPDDWRPPDPSVRDGRLVPFSLAGTANARPGHTGTPEWIDLERLATEAAARGTPDWGVPEWEATSTRGSRRDMLRYLTRLYRHGAAVTANWGGWWGATGNPYHLDGTPGASGMQAWLDGEDVPGTGVAVGDSTLAGPLDYSDGWTDGVNGRVADGRFPVTGDALRVENAYGNPSRAWSTAKWSLRQDGNVFWTIFSPDPRGNWSGSRRGMTETGGAVDFGIEYGLRRDLVLQADVVQTDDRVALTVAGARDTTARADGLSVFFRPAGSAIEVGLYNAGVGERDTGFRPRLAAWSFANYAVRFDLDRRLVTIHVDENALGTIDLATFAGGAFSGLVVSNAAVSIGARGLFGDRVWTDNFQVGAPCPAPPPVGSGLRVSRDGADVVLDWRTDPARAYAYRADTSATPSFAGSETIGTSREKRLRDAGAALVAAPAFYRVSAVNACDPERTVARSKGGGDETP